MTGPPVGGPAKLAMFDLDNTLIDRQAAFARWAADFVRSRDLGDEALAFIVELDDDGFASREEVFAPLHDRYGLPETVGTLIEQYRAVYPAYSVPEPLVVAELARLRGKGWRTAIVTNGPPSQHEKIARAGLADSFDAVCVSSELGAAKPDPRIFEEAARRCGAELASWAQAWMTGDAPGPDVFGGASAGLRTIWMRREREWSEEGFRPDATVDTLAQAVDVLLAASA